MARCDRIGLSLGERRINVIGNLRTLAHRAIPAVLVTGDTSSEVSKALERVGGGCEVLSKPFVPNKFLEVVSQLAAANLSTN